jgi:hyperosmotically inducible protein
MRVFAVIILLVLVAFATYWFLGNPASKQQIKNAGESISNGATHAADTVRDKLHDLNFKTEDIKEELARTGQIVREKAREVGSKVADATADARVTGSIKSRLVADPDLSALSISVSTTDRTVTLSGSVRTHDDIKKAMDLALATDGCDKVVSTLQVKP